MVINFCTKFLVEIQYYDKHMHLFEPDYKKTAIIELVDSISRDGPDMRIYVICYKKLKNSDQIKF